MHMRNVDNQHKAKQEHGPFTAVLQVHALLYHNSWETRVIAAATIGGLADVFPHHSAKDLAANCSLAGGQQQLQEQLCYQVDVPLASFDIENVLKHGEVLLASGGQVGQQAVSGKACTTCVSVPQ